MLDRRLEGKGKEKGHEFVFIKYLQPYVLLLNLHSWVPYHWFWSNLHISGYYFAFQVLVYVYQEVIHWCCLQYISWTSTKFNIGRCFPIQVLSLLDDWTSCHVLNKGQVECCVLQKQKQKKNGGHCVLSCNIIWTSLRLLHIKM